MASSSSSPVPPPADAADDAPLAAGTSGAAGPSGTCGIPLPIGECYAVDDHEGARRPHSPIGNTVRVAAAVALIAVVALVGTVIVRRPATPSVVLLDQSPAASVNTLRAQMGRLQQQMGELRARMALPSSNPESEPEQLWPVYYSDAENQDKWPTAQRRHAAWQPMRKRRIAWQPMRKRNNPEPETDGYGMTDEMGAYGNGGDVERKEHVMRAVEHELAVVLRAGQRLGVSAQQILTHLRAQQGDDGITEMMPRGGGR